MHHQQCHLIRIDLFELFGELSYGDFAPGIAQLLGNLGDRKCPEHHAAELKERLGVPLPIGISWHVNLVVHACEA